MEVRRGAIWWVDFGDPLGAEPGYRRPAIVVSADYLNLTAIKTVLVLPLSTTLRLANLPGNVLLPAGSGGLAKDSVAVAPQLVVIDRSRLEDRIGAVPPALMRRIDQGLRTVLALQ